MGKRNNSIIISAVLVAFFVGTIFSSPNYALALPPWANDILDRLGIVESDLVNNVCKSDGTNCPPPTGGGSGDITAVIAGTGLTGGATSGDATLNVDTTTIQQRVSGTCAVGSSIRTINADGTVVCKTGPIVGSWSPSSTTTGIAFVNWDNQKINTDTNTFGFTSGADHILIQQSGTYLVTANVVTSDLSAGESGVWQLQKNGASICSSTFNAGGAFHHTNCTLITTFAASDELQLQNLSSSNNIIGTSSGVHTSLSVQKLS